jgi:hypothetical protein
VLPREDGSADLLQERAAIHHVSGNSLLKILSFCQTNISFRSGLFSRHLAISDQRPSRRLSPEIEVAAIFGKGRVSRKFQASHASKQDLPGPLLAFIAIRCLLGNTLRTSSCHGSGVAWKSSRTITSGRSRQSLSLLAANSILNLCLLQRT